MALADPATLRVGREVIADNGMGVNVQGRVTANTLDSMTGIRTITVNGIDFLVQPPPMPPMSTFLEVRAQSPPSPPPAFKIGETPVRRSKSGSSRRRRSRKQKRTRRVVRRMIRA